jgi:hypothetical protein
MGRDCRAILPAPKGRGIFEPDGRAEWQPVDSTQISGYGFLVASIGFTYWQDGQVWLGYLDEFPD